jgi:hypothetical protein
MRFRASVPRPPSRSGLDRSDRFVLTLFAALAALVGIVSLVGAVPGIAGLFSDTVTVAVSSDMAVPTDAASGSASIVSGTFDRAVLVVSGIDLGARIALAGSAVATTLTTAAVAASVVALCVAILKGRPFVRSVTWLLATASITLIAGSIIGAGLDTIAMFFIAAALNPEPIDSVFPLASEYDFAPLLIGLVLGVVATAFQLGQKMQRDTDGLV